MKRYAILTVVVLAILVVAWTAFGQEEGRAERRQQIENMRQRFQNMSEEEREKFRAEMRERFGRGGFMSPEERLKSIKAIEEQLAKLKKETQIPRPEGGFQDLSEEERAKYREQRMKVSQERQKTLQTIIAQVARLQGRRQPPVEGERFLILSTNDLKPIQDSAMKEKAKETSQLLERLVARGSGRGFGGGRRTGSGQRPQGGGQRGQ